MYFSRLHGLWSPFSFLHLASSPCWEWCQWLHPVSPWTPPDSVSPKFSKEKMWWTKPGSSWAPLTPAKQPTFWSLWIYRASCLPMLYLRIPMIVPYGLSCDFSCSTRALPHWDICQIHLNSVDFRPGTARACERMMWCAARYGSVSGFSCDCRTRVHFGTEWWVFRIDWSVYKTMVCCICICICWY